MSHDINDRITVAVNWLITGSVKETSTLTGIAERTIRDWMSRPWWDTLLEEAKDIKQNELDSLWTQIIHIATEQLKDRLMNGDVVLNRAGKTVRVPIKASQLTLVAAIASDKRDRVRKRKVEVP